MPIELVNCRWELNYKLWAWKSVRSELGKQSLMTEYKDLGREFRVYPLCNTEPPKTNHQIWFLWDQEMDRFDNLNIMRKYY